MISLPSVAMETTLEAILAEQADSGAFRSTIHNGEHAIADWNGFTTAHVLRALDLLPAQPTLERARRRALAFLQSCESRSHPGAFGFWPAGMQPDWVGRLPEDADDTAVIAVELARHGLLSQRELLRIACTILLPHRLRRVGELAPPWLRPRVFLTWLDHDLRHNIVDCTVNANVVALLARANATHLPGYHDACAMIVDAVRWAGEAPARARSLSPFYAGPGELQVAVEHAIACGAVDLLPALELLRRQPWSQAISEARDDSPLWSSAYGSVIWRSPALQLARQLQHTTISQSAW